MPMFESEEAFEAYLAEQQAQLAAEQPSTQPTRREPRSLWQDPHRLLGLLIPLVLVGAGVFYISTQKHDQHYADDTWDKIFRTMAWVSGREYDANADNLTDRMTFRKKGDK